eukprot:4852757-Pleurochrysis_carterae.AAC.1
MASISSMKMMAGEFFSASSNALRRFDSDSPVSPRGRRVWLQRECRNAIAGTCLAAVSQETCCPLR